MAHSRHFPSVAASSSWLFPLAIAPSFASSTVDLAMSIDRSSPSSATLYQTAPFGNMTTRMLSSPAMKGTHVELVDTLSNLTDTDVFQLSVVVQPVLRTFAANARLLDAAKRRDFRGDDAGIDTDDAAL